MGDDIGRELEVEVGKIAHGGISVARHEGRVIFVNDAIPGERVVARVSDDRKKRFWRADTVRVIEASEHRREHVWGAASVDRDPAERAGGAEFGHIELAHQRELKAQVLMEALDRTGGIDADTLADALGADRLTIEGLPGEPDGTGWRTRVRLNVDEQGRLGPYAARSHRVIPVNDLPLATPEVQAAAPLGERFAGEPHVDVLAPSVGSARLIIGKQARSTITERVGEREFALADSGFWQVHRHAASTLTAAVQQAVDPAQFDPASANLDLYGGVGLLAAALGDRFGSGLRITSVESDAIATDYAAENLAEWVGARAVTSRVEAFLRQLAAGSAPERARLESATVVLDPPRAGAGLDVVDALASLRPAQLVYVACDPVAFARDAGALRERGYRLASLRSFDLFPNTHHVEAVASLVRE
ncbi:class I SAM-dependent RNA methyltransferase [Ruicaihuangia caeni]|uniref:class I SAM-dependent RNA methyltransferase n=1 Tax=Ruicaihuangia caeni TaxID=3042517 RepID=UPI00338FAF93